MATSDHHAGAGDRRASALIGALNTVDSLAHPSLQYNETSSAIHPPGRAPTGGQSHAHRPVSAMPTPATRTYQPTSRNEHDYYPDRRASAHPTLPTSSTQPVQFLPPSLPDAVTSNAISQGIPITSPAALQYFAAHPRRQQVHFGNYLLLQTLGEGEFGKVKLGVHKEWGEEVAVKLIKRDKVGTADGQLQITGPSKDPTKMSKVEKEIRVLKDVRHPNIVRLYEVIESDRYIGIVLEYASGGELFDHILAHKYLKERDACRLFAQLISGVFYLHEKKIVHRDLKLENLLLDRNRNVIITDFGFANNFENKTDDLMATSCGSPCYAAPELVVQDGLYAGSAVDVWSCGVILYAMLAGYLPFDDDPANPDGDNINLLYKYIMATPLSFPDYITAQPRDLLSRMLVPDPTKRADLRMVMAHPWLAPYRELFKFSVDELERAAIEQQNKKRQVYRQQILLQQQMQDQQRQNGRNQDNGGSQMSVKQQRHQSAMAAPSHSQTSASRARIDLSMPVSATSVALSLPVGNGNQSTSARDITMRDAAPDTSSGRKPAGSKTQRHTVQLEYDSAANLASRPLGVAPSQNHSMSEAPSLPVQAHPDFNDGQQADAASASRDLRSGFTLPEQAAKSVDTKATRSSQVSEEPLSSKSDARSSEKSTHSRTSSSTQRRQSAVPRNASNPLPQGIPQSASITTPNAPAPTGITPIITHDGKRIVSAEPPSTSDLAKAEKSQARHRKGMSTDKFLLGKLLGTHSSPVPSNDVLQQINDNSVKDKGKGSVSTANGASADTSIANNRGRRTSTARRKAMSLVVGRAPESTADSEKSTKPERRLTARLRKETLASDIKRPETPKRTTSNAQDRLAAKPSPSAASVMTTRSSSTAASSNAARKVMDWFRKKSVVDDKSVMETPSTQTTPRATKVPISGASATPPGTSAATPSVVITASTTENQALNEMDSLPSSRSTSGTHSQTSQATDATGTTTITDVSAAIATPSGHKSSSASTSTVQPAQQATPRASAAPVRSVDGALRVHQGPVDQSALTSRDPVAVFREVQRALWDMGIEARRESETTYKLECVRRKRAKTLIDIGQSIKTSVFPPSQADYDRSASNARLPSSPSSMLSPSQSSVRNFLRRNSSQHSADTHMPPPTYGEPSVDNGGEVRFSVELTKLRLLPGLYIVDLKRMRGNIWAYKHLNRSLLGRLDLVGPTAGQIASSSAN